MDKILRDNSNCVDVGCHKGAILNQIILRSPDGQHYAFEPLPELYRGLKKKYERKPNVKLFDCALSDSCGESTYQHVVTNPGYSGLRQRRYDRAEEKIVQLMVRIEMLDNVIPEDVQVRFIKIDVEGGGAAGPKRCSEDNQAMSAFHHI
jgi:FkbM family methyltransferase